MPVGCIKSMTDDTVPANTFVDMARLAKEELDGANMYHKMGLNDLAKDELRHANFFIDKSSTIAKTHEDKATLQTLQQKLGELVIALR